MNPNDQIPMPEEALELGENEKGGSVDDFLKQLEERERDLHITADLSIEIEESEFDPRNISDETAAAALDVPSAAGQVSQRAQHRPEPQKDQPGLKTQVYELKQEIAKLNARIEELKIERNEIQEKSDRRLKDFESYKYRMDRERRGAFIDQISNLAGQMLPVLDNLDRAIDAASSNGTAKSEDFQRFFDGIVLVNQQVREVFTEMGVEPILAVGKEFDPNLHEAVAMDECADAPANTVVAEMLRGYRIGNRVIRHSMVKVTPASAQNLGISEPKRSETAEAVTGPAAETAVIDVAAGDDSLQDGSPERSEQ